MKAAGTTGSYTESVTWNLRVPLSDAEAWKEVACAWLVLPSQLAAYEWAAVACVLAAMEAQ